MHRNTLIQRYIVTLFASVMRSGINFTTAILLARFLGPMDYGRMAFMVASLLAFKQLFDVASSSAFFTFMSQKQRSQKFIKFYWCWVALQASISILLVRWLVPEEMLSLVWGNEPRALILLALLATFMQNTVWADVTQMAEAQRETLKIQILTVLLVLVNLLVVCGLWWFNEIAIPLIFLAIVVEWGFASSIAFNLYKPYSKNFSEGHVAEDSYSAIFKKFIVFCLPLIPYVWVCFFHDLADRLMLQKWGGTIEQAFYAVAQQFSAVVLLLTSTMLRILWKEVAEASQQKNSTAVKAIYHRVTKLSFFMGSFLAGAFIPWSGEIVRLLLGAEYLGGTLALTIMFLYPIHQSLGQINGTMLYATGRSRLQSVLGIFYMVFGSIVTYFLLAPADALIPGLSMGSQGLAWKMVCVQVVAVNITSWFISREFGWKFEYRFQIKSLFSCICMSWVCQVIVESALGGIFPLAVTFAITIALYGIAISALVFRYPEMIGVKRFEIVQVAKVLVSIFDKRFSRH